MSEDLENCQIGKTSHGMKKASYLARLKIEVRGSGDVGTFPCGACYPAIRGSCSLVMCMGLRGNGCRETSPHPHIHYYTAPGGEPPIIPTPYF
jgi:hypothetical protein